jgi:hypothetical protein
MYWIVGLLSLDYEFDLATWLGQLFNLSSMQGHVFSLNILPLWGQWRNPGESVGVSQRHACALFALAVVPTMLEAVAGPR